MIRCSGNAIRCLSIVWLAIAAAFDATTAAATLIQIPPSGAQATPSAAGSAFDARSVPSAVPPALLQGLQGYTLVAGKTSALRIYLDDPSVFASIRRVEAVIMRPDGGIGTIAWTGDEIRAAVAHPSPPQAPASLVVRIPGSELDLVGRYRIEVYLLDADDQVVHDVALDAIDLLPTKDVRFAVDRIWSGTPTKPGEYDAAIEGLTLLGKIWPVRDGIAEFDQSDTAGVRYLLNDNPQPMDAHLGPFFDSAHFRAPGLDFADTGIAYRFPNDGEGSGANASHVWNGLPFSVVVWGAPLGWVFSHESAHIEGLVPSTSPHWDGGVHSADQFIDPTDAVFGYDPIRHRAWSDVMYDIMYPYGSGNEDSYGLSSWDWEFVRQSVMSLPSTGPTGPVLVWQSLDGVSLQSELATAVNLDGRREAYVLGGDGAIYARWQTLVGDWNPWVSLSGSGHHGPVRAWRLGDGRLAIFVRAPDNTVIYRAQFFAGGGWGSWTTLGATTFKGFALAENADGRLEVVGVGNDGQLYTARQTSVGGGFDPWVARGGVSLSGNVAGARNADGRVEAFVIGGDGVVYRQAQMSPGSSTWSSWGNVYDPSFASAIDLGVAPDSDGRLTVAILKADGSAAVRAQSAPNGGFEPPVPLGGTGGQSGFALARSGDDRLELFVVRSDSTLWHRHQTEPARNDTWSPWTQLGTTSLLHRAAVGEHSGDGVGVFAVSSTGALLYAERADQAPLELVGSMSLCGGGPRFILGEKLKLAVAKIGADTRPGNDSLRFAGELAMPNGWNIDTFAADIDGVHMRVTGVSDAILVEASLTGTYGGAGTRGWKRAGHALAYIDRTGSPVAGIRKAKIKRSTTGYNRVQLSIKGSKATYAITPSDAPLQISAVLGPIGFARARLECGETAFDPASCVENAAQTAVTCEQ